MTKLCLYGSLLLDWSFCSLFFFDPCCKLLCFTVLKCNFFFSDKRKEVKKMFNIERRFKIQEHEVVIGPVGVSGLSNCNCNRKNMFPLGRSLN